MMITRKLGLAIVATAIGIGLAGAPASAEAQNRSRNRNRNDIDTSFAFDRTGTVTLGNGSAEIIVTGWDQPTIRVRADGDGGDLRFTASAKRVTIDPSRSSDDVTIEIMVPRGVRVEARTNSGDIVIHGTRGDVDAQTTSGDVDIGDVKAVTAGSLSGDLSIRQTSGGVTATSNNGDVSIADAHGNIDVTSISGDVSISRVVAKIVRANTTNGDIGYSGTVEPQGTYELTTHSGDIELILPKDASAQVGVSTWNGEIDSEFPITLRPGGNTASGLTKHYTFTIGAGSARITAESFNGDIVITSRGGR